MAHAYCTDCSARVTVVDGRCLLDHRIDPSTISEGSGKRTRGRSTRHTKNRFRSAGEPVAASTPEPTPSVAERLDQFELDLRPSSPSPSPPPPEPTDNPELATEIDRQTAGVTTLEHPKLEPKQPIRHVLAPTNDLIDRMWTTGREASDLDGWTVQELDTEGSVMARRVFIGTVLTAAIALLLASTWFVAGRGDATVEATLDEIGDASETLNETLAGTGSVIADFATGELQDREGAVSAATELDAAARTLFGHASNLPTTDEWADLRSETVSVSDRSIATARLLSRTTSYTATIDVMFNRPAYPLTADDAEIGDIAEMTAIWVSRFIATSSSLPEVNALEGHRAEVEAFAASLPDWQSRYLDALRAGDVEATGAAVGELEEAVIALDTDLGEAVRSIAQELSDQRSALMSDLGA